MIKKRRTETNRKLQLKMFYQTYTARKPLSACARVNPSPPAATEWSRLLLHLRCVRRTRYNACQSGWLSSFPGFVPGDLDFWPRHSNSSKRGTKHVFAVNLVQIRSAVPEIFKWQTNKEKQNWSQTALKTESYLRAAKHVVQTVKEAESWLKPHLLANLTILPILNKSSAVAEMSDRGHNRHGPKKGGYCAPFAGELGPV